MKSGRLVWTLVACLTSLGPVSAWAQAPEVAPAGYDACVNRVRWTLQNDLSSIPPDNTGDVQLVARLD